MSGETDGVQSCAPWYKKLEKITLSNSSTRRRVCKVRERESKVKKFNIFVYQILNFAIQLSIIFKFNLTMYTQTSQKDWIDEARPIMAMCRMEKIAKPIYK